jgi:hypothetical protein
MRPVVLPCGRLSKSDLEGPTEGNSFLFGGVTSFRSVKEESAPFSREDADSLSRGYNISSF